MGACTTKSPSHHRKEKKSNGTAVTSLESPLKNHDAKRSGENIAMANLD